MSHGHKCSKAQKGQKSEMRVLPKSLVGHHRHLSTLRKKTAKSYIWFDVLTLTKETGMSCICFDGARYTEIMSCNGKQLHRSLPSSVGIHRTNIEKQTRAASWTWEDSGQSRRLLTCLVELQIQNARRSRGTLCRWALRVLIGSWCLTAIRGYHMPRERTSSENVNDCAWSLTGPRSPD